MKKIILTLLGFILALDFVYGGGLITNTNQSAAWSRLLVRDASTDIDAVFYNPAGLVKLNDGFHISLSNQSIFQTQTITSTFPYLNNGEFVGDVSAPLFPSVYLAYKTGRWAFSLGLNVIGGGGSADFKSGVPMMAIPVANLVPLLRQIPDIPEVNGYSLDMAFSGKSAYWGLQAGISFALTDNISIFAGARYVMAKNTYEGHMKDIMLTTADGSIRADAYIMTYPVPYLQTGADQALQAATLMQPLVQNFGDKTIQNLLDAGVLTPEQAVMMQGGLIQFGVPEDQIPYMDMTTIQGTFYGANQQLTTQVNQLKAGAALMADQEADVTQKGNGITPIIGANFSFFDNDFNIGVKYEFKTKLDLKNSTAAGKGFTIGFDSEGKPIEMFPDGEVTNADIPAFLTVGVDYRIIDPLKVSIGYHRYFDKQTGWAKEAEGNGQAVIDKDYYELGIGLQYDINDNFLVSAGYLYAKPGVNQYYQSNLSYDITSHTVGLGGAWAINDIFTIQLGGFYVMYDPTTYRYTEDQTGIQYRDTYEKSTWAVSLGLDIALGTKK